MVVVIWVVRWRFGFYIKVLVRILVGYIRFLLVFVYVSG